MSWYKGAAKKDTEDNGGEDEGVANEGKQKHKASKSWREGCSIGSMDMSPGNTTPKDAGKGKSKGRSHKSGRVLE